MVYGTLNDVLPMWFHGSKPRDVFLSLVSNFLPVSSCVKHRLRLNPGGSNVTRQEASTDANVRVIQRYYSFILS